MDNAQPVVIPERNDQLGKGLVGYPTSQLTVQRIRRSLSQGIAIDVVDCTPEWSSIEQCTLDAFSIAFEPLVYTKPGTRGPAELATNLLFLTGDMFCGFADQLMMRVMPGESRRIGRAFRST